MKWERIFLAGFMGAGKTTVGKLLAQRLGWTFVDLDEVIEEGERQTVSEIFRLHGEPYFRDIEHRYMGKVSVMPDVVVALGGGTFVRGDNRELAEKSGLTVWLKVSFQKATERVKIDGTRPMFQDREQAARLFKSREPSYRLAKLHVLTDNRPCETIANEILKVILEL